MDPQGQNQFSQTGATSLSSFMQRVYFWMALGLGVTGVAAFVTLLDIGFLKFLAKGGMWLFFIAEIGLVFWLSANISRISAGAATMGFLVYSALNGITLSVILLVYTAASVYTSFLITAGMFAGVSVYGWATKQDLSSVGSLCGMAIWGLILASVINIFFHAPAFNYILSYLGVAIFVGLTAYDTQRLKMIHQNMPDAPNQMAIMGALALYLDFINMFLFVLRLFGRRQ
jgi:FtsH-binding integral membrane protein